MINANARMARVKVFVRIGGDNDDEIQFSRESKIGVDEDLFEINDQVIRVICEIMRYVKPIFVSSHIHSLFLLPNMWIVYDGF